MTRRLLALACLALCAGPAIDARRAGPAFTVPPGFAVEEVYAPERSGSIVAFTFDAAGRLVVSKDHGPVVRLLDDNGDGRIDREQVVTERVTACQGLLFEGHDLYAVGEGPDGPGLYRVSDPDGDGAGDDVALVTRATDSAGEHGSHAVFYGPDGWLYWELGNFTGLVAAPDPLSPYQPRGEGQIIPILVDPNGHAIANRAPGGFIARRDPGRADGDWQLVTGGFRNAYDGAFNLDGELFTFDSDMEWDIGLPWYRPVRTLHTPPGGEFGWRTGSGVWPPHYPDSLPGMFDVGRGSPTGVAFYQHHAFPPEYHDAFFEADWSRGRILVGRLTRAGATYRESSSEFLQGVPLNVTDVETGPDGALYFTKGGRRTEGGVYRVVYGNAAPAAAGAWLDRVLAQPAPRSAWGRAALRRAKAEAGAAWAPELTRVVQSPAAAPGSRVRAIELLQVHGPALDVAALAGLSRDASADVRAAAVYHLGLHPTGESRAALAAALRDGDPFVRRRACEALVRTGITPRTDLPFDAAGALLPLLGDDDRFVRFAARELLVRTNRNRWHDGVLALDRYPAVTEGLIALVHTATFAQDAREVLRRVNELLEAGPTTDQLAGLLRALHLAMEADAGVAYASLYKQIGDQLLARFPSADPVVDRELALTFARLRPAGALPKLVAALTTGDPSRELQIFYAYVLRRFDTGWDDETREAVVRWFQRTQDEGWKGGNSFAGYLSDIFTEFVSRQPEDERQAILDAVPGLGPPAAEGDPAPWKKLTQGSRVSEQELFEYLEFDPMAYRGNVEKGREIYEKAFCATCHRFGELGEAVGPDLTDVGRRFRRKDIVESIVYPSRTISEQWASVEFTTTGRQSVVGTILAESPDAVTVRTVSGDTVRLEKAGIAKREAATVSAMPEGLLGGLSLEQIRDLLTFLEQGSGSR